jgi:hypothetical protein
MRFGSVFTQFITAGPYSGRHREGAKSGILGFIAGGISVIRQRVRVTLVPHLALREPALMP